MQPNFELRQVILIWLELTDKGKPGRCWSPLFVVLCSVDTDFTWNPWDDSYWIESGFIFLSVYSCRFFSFLGGPGSRKGKLLDDVSHVYGLKLISTETVLMEELSKKLENPNSSKRTEDIAALLKVSTSYKHIKFILLIMLIMYYLVYVMRPKEFNITIT